VITPSSLSPTASYRAFSEKPAACATMAFGLVAEFFFGHGLDQQDAVSRVARGHQHVGIRHLELLNLSRQRRRIGPVLDVANDLVAGLIGQFGLCVPTAKMFSESDVRLLDAMKKKGTKDRHLAVPRNTIFGTDLVERTDQNWPISPATRSLATSSTGPNSPSLSAEVQQLKVANADVLMPSSYTTDGIPADQDQWPNSATSPTPSLAQAAGFSEKALYDAVGDKLDGVITRGQLFARSRRQAADGRQDQRHVQGEVGQGSERQHVARISWPDSCWLMPSIAPSRSKGKR